MIEIRNKFTYKHIIIYFHNSQKINITLCSIQSHSVGSYSSSVRKSKINLKILPMSSPMSYNLEEVISDPSVIVFLL